MTGEEVCVKMEKKRYEYDTAIHCIPEKGTEIRFMLSSRREMCKEGAPALRHVHLISQT